MKRFVSIWGSSTIPGSLRTVFKDAWFSLSTVKIKVVDFGMASLKASNASDIYPFPRYSAAVRMHTSRERGVVVTAVEIIAPTILWEVLSSRIK